MKLKRAVELWEAKGLACTSRIKQLGSASLSKWWDNGVFSVEGEPVVSRKGVLQAPSVMKEYTSLNRQKREVSKSANVGPTLATRKGNMMDKRTQFSVTGLMVIFAGIMLFAGCRDRQEPLILHFVFNDARGITVGDKVLGDGVEVGRIIAPPDSSRPRHVVISARIDGLSDDKLAYVTEELTAVIRKDSLVAGQTYLDLEFPDRPGPTVESGTILKGRGGPDISSVQWPDFPKDPKELVGLFQRLFVAVTPMADGALPFYLNWISILMAIAVLAVMILDLLIRLPQGKERERSSPLLFRKIWSFFCVLLVIRVAMFAIRLMGGMGVLGSELLAALRISGGDFMELLTQEWPFWVLVIVLSGIRFKLDLLMRVKSSK